MRLKPFDRFQAPPDEYDQDYFNRTLADLETYITNIHQALDQLGFGDGTDVDNIIGKWVTYTTNAVADTEDAVSHNLGAVPVGVLTMVPPTSGFLYRGTTAWTTSNIYLKCSAAARTVTVFILIPSHGLLD